MEAEENGSQTRHRRAEKKRMSIANLTSVPCVQGRDAAEEQGRRTMCDDPAEKSAKFDEDAAAIAPDAT